jgi:predicted nucleotidyltransferase
MTNKITGIVAEWNPFHRGHEAMIQKLKENNPDISIFGVMSGSFVQRGEPALFDPWTRAKWAVEAGVDAIFELPVLATLQKKGPGSFSPWAAAPSISAPNPWKRKS